MTFYSQEQLNAFGFRRLGSDVRLSDTVSVYNAANIEIGDNSRVGDFCVLSAGEGGIVIGRNVRIDAHSVLMGAERIEIGDFTSLSARVSIYSSSDDYSGKFMTNPTVPAAYTNVIRAAVVVEQSVIVGASAVILPGVTLHEGTAICAMSVIKQDCKAFGVYAGTPAKFIGQRAQDRTGSGPGRDATTR